ncbi:MAG: XdhC family protein [Planctomycetes bacterium]|nr:XdhC family protein [Planctomycetota bacterium]
MAERTLWATLERVLASGLRCAVCTVVETRGSTPQKAGAAMLVFPDGTQTGTLGGGCVEAEVRRRALAGLAEGVGHASLHTFLLDNDYGWDDGLICGGRMTVLADPVEPTDGDYFRRLREAAESGTGFTEVVALANNSAGELPGSRHLFATDGTLTASRPEPPVNVAALNSALAPAGLTRPQPGVRGGLAVLPDYPRVRLLIVGGGHVGQAVAALATDCDFEVWVLDDRESVVSEERFPKATRRLSGVFGKTLADVVPEITPTTYCLIVTRGHNHDEEALFHLAPTPAAYVGMIGSKRKVRLIYDDLLAKGISEESLARVRAPVGLPIGSRSVPEIAVSILAELIAFRNGATDLISTNTNDSCSISG